MRRDRRSFREIEDSVNKAVQQFEDARTDAEQRNALEKLKSLKMEHEEKLKNMEKARLNLADETENLELEIVYLKKHLAKMKRDAEKFDAFIIARMQEADLQKHGRMSIGKSPPKVVIIDEDAIPDKFKRERIETDVSKSEILQAYKRGEIIPGVEIQSENLHMRYKREKRTIEEE